MGSTHCIKCGKPLSDPKSIDHSMGPICFRTVFDDMSERTDGEDVCDLPFDEEARDIVCRRDEDGKCHFNFAQVIVKHSPTGMEWGYGGSGPADFAINALLAITGDRHLARSPLAYQSFKERYVAKLPQEGGTISGAEVLESLRAVEARNPGWTARQRRVGLDEERYERRRLALERGKRGGRMGLAAAMMF